jgi:hypothetical protein
MQIGHLLWKRQSLDASTGLGAGLVPICTCCNSSAPATRPGRQAVGQRFCWHAARNLASQVSRLREAHPKRLETKSPALAACLLFQEILGVSEAGEAPCDDPQSPGVTGVLFPGQPTFGSDEVRVRSCSKAAKVWSTSIALCGLPKSVQPEGPSLNTKRRSGAADRTSFEKSIGSIPR